MVRIDIESRSSPDQAALGQSRTKRLIGQCVPSFVENYTSHVNDGKERFSIGRWLRTLTDSQLAELLAMTEQLVREPGSPKLDDVVYVVKIAHNRETGKSGFPKPKLVIKAAIRLVMLVSFISFERSGWMIMKSPLRVSSNKDIDFELTEAGKIEALEADAQINKSSLH